jgi:hypothetical protein
MQYTSTGGLNLEGNFLIKRIKYSVGDFVFIKEKALKGVIDRVCIKKYFTIYEYKYYYFKYQDTFNRVWFENELILQQEAVDLAISYNER